MIRKCIVVLALAFGGIAATSDMAEATFCQPATTTASCYSYSPSPCVQPCPYYYCVVYRYDYCCCRWVCDSTYYGPWANYYAQQRVNQLKCCGIPAYHCCYAC